MIFRHFLKIPDVKERFVRNRVNLLKDIVRASVLAFPFQNVTSFGVPDPGPKAIPRFKSILDAFLSGCGGMCGHNNYSMKLLLQSIGFETYVAAAKFRRTSVPGSHVVCMVKIPPPFSVDRSTEDLYVVDVGCGVPIHEPIRIQGLPLRGRAGGLDFVYELDAEGTKVNRIHTGGDAIAGERPMDHLSPQDYTIWLAPAQFADIYKAWGEVYGVPKTSAFHSTFYLYRYLDIEQDGSDFKIVCIRGKELVFITKETRQAESFESFEQIRPLIFEYFPMIPKDQVNTAVSNFGKIESGEVKI